MEEYDFNSRMTKHKAIIKDDIIFVCPVLDCYRIRHKTGGGEIRSENLKFTNFNTNKISKRAFLRFI